MIRASHQGAVRAAGVVLAGIAVPAADARQQTAATQTAGRASATRTAVPCAKTTDAAREGAPAPTARLVLVDAARTGEVHSKIPGQPVAETAARPDETTGDGMTAVVPADGMTMAVPADGMTAAVPADGIRTGGHPQAGRARGGSGCTPRNEHCSSSSA